MTSSREGRFANRPHNHTGGEGSEPPPPELFVQPFIREVHKNAWLRRVKNEKRAGKRSGEKKWWVVFCVHDDVEAYLEFYDAPKLTGGHRPMHAIPLKHTQHVTTSALVGGGGGGPEEVAEFAVTLPTGVIHLVAQSWEQMIEWVESLQGKLREMKILGPKHNLYSNPPKLIVSSTRDPNSPLPPPPVHPPPQNPLTEEEHNTLGENHHPPNPPRLEGVEPLSESDSLIPSTTNNLYEHLFLPDFSVINPQTHPKHYYVNTTGPPVPGRSDLIQKRIQRPGPRASSLTRLPINRDTINPSSSSSSQDEYEQTPLEGMIGVESSGEYRINREEDGNSSSLISNPLNLQVPLKEAQVLRLENEMKHKAGVRLVLRKRDLINSIALVDWQGGVWIAGWKQTEFPILYFCFHVGDQIVRVGGATVHSVEETHHAIRVATTTEVEIVVRRLPLGKVWVLKRSVEGEPLGLVAEGGTGEISEVLEGGLAWKEGVGCGPNGNNWYLTEINNRPLSLFSKDNQVKDRLNAVGKEISILLQPSTLVKYMRKELKHQKGFKDYIVG